MNQSVAKKGSAARDSDGCHGGHWGRECADDFSGLSGEFSSDNRPFNG